MSGARWRLLVEDGVGAAAGLAADEAMLAPFAAGQRSPFAAALRLYTYRPHCALVGRYQSLEDEVDEAACAAAGVEVGRRPTGGGAILMGPDQLGVALALPAPLDEPPRLTLARLARGVVAGLARLGVEAHFRSKNDLEVGGRKVAGLGLYRDERGAMLFHSSVLVDLDVPLMLRVLRIPGAKLADKGVERVQERVTTLRREVGAGLTSEEARQAVAAGMAATFGVEVVAAAVDAAEGAHRDELRSGKYDLQAGSASAARATTAPARRCSRLPRGWCGCTSACTRRRSRASSSPATSTPCRPVSRRSRRPCAGTRPTPRR